MRGIQYAAAYRFNHCCLWDTGSPARSQLHGRVMTTEYASAFSRRVSPEVLQCRSRPSIKRAQGMPGAGWHPRSRVQIVRRESAHEHTGTAGAARHSLRSGFTAYTVLSPETNSSCLHRRRIEGLRIPVGLRKTSAGLTPATGARTTRFCRPQQSLSSARGVRSQERPALRKHLARPALPRPPLPAPYVRDDRDTPLLWGGMAGFYF